MKKILSLLLSFYMCLCFVACVNNKVEGMNENQVCIIDLEKCEIGYELPVDPDYDFKFKTNKGEIVEISNFKATLKEKNSLINEDVIDENSLKCEYIIKVSFDGKTDPALAGKSVYFSHKIVANVHGGGTVSVVGEDGTFKVDAKFRSDRYIIDFKFGRLELL